METTKKENKIFTADHQKSSLSNDKNSSAKSLTNDESAKTDPNVVPDKASFSDNRKKNTVEKGRFDGTIGI